jgi:hypothetical protein
MTDPLILKAREIALREKPRSHVVERAFNAGAYDKGSWVKDWLPQAEIELLKARTEDVPE